MDQPTLLLLESDSRLYGKSNATGAVNYGPNNMPNKYDWRVWSSAGFGKVIQNSLPKGDGYWSEVHDCGKYVSVRAGYNSVAAGKSVAKSFVIVFDSVKSGDGKIFASSTKWRTISNYTQAASYISSVIRSLANQANQQI